ncbi:hypothetical protein NIES37_10170 [Tolypothrix tenuis PCC 7101]|uniref:Uncharacterized protein n=1 Tax=Tolypothrix tenuis PCC 7101 TaxID=231146 RepID=A0A1Z4MUD0_9CYAN|nr:hypothetical protein [Aulosira sp. FACHB-113]BAY97080.1 hypothetical protein NIES37_10170 [Tolypothrix tenuis PCC 7101]BAZ72412.1 hypothetical protein NIES50_09660 [Aulosira laxa NIES-50]
MTNIHKQSHVSSVTSHIPQGVILTLALTSLLSYGIGLSSNNTANAAPRAAQVQLSQNVQNSGNRLPKAVAQAVLNDASKRSGVAIANLKITQATAKTFANPCIFQFGEVCTREYRPIQGWEVIVQVNEQSWTYHANRNGSQILLDPKINVSGNVTLPRAIANKVLADAAKRSGVAVANLQITQATAKTFGNQCHFNFGEVCAEIYKPVEGWEVSVKVKEQSWTYHVNKSGSQIVLDPKIKTSPNATLPRAIANKVLADAAKRSGVAVANLQITQATAKTFGNPCEFNFGDICTKEFNPVEGWEVSVKVKEQAWTYHVNKSGSQIVLDPKIKV